MYHTCTIKNFKILDFEIPENVLWRKSKDLTTSQKLKFISEHNQQTLQMPKEFLDQFKMEMTAQYVCESNKVCSVGLQSYEKVLETLMNEDTTIIESSIEEQAVWYMDKALKEKPERILSMENIETLHRNMLAEGGGTMRTDMTRVKRFTTRPDGTIHYYPDGSLVPPMLEGVIGQHNIHMVLSHERKDEISFLLKSAAWLIARFIAIHPFPDGNERMSNLLANQVLSRLCILFPVHVYKTGEVDRKYFIDALIQCQNEHQQPENLSALLLDSVYNGMKKMNEEYQQWMTHRKCVIIQFTGPFDVSKKVKSIPHATREDRQEINKLCYTEVPKDCYKQVVLHDHSRNIDYVVRKVGMQDLDSRLFRR